MLKLYNTLTKQKEEYELVVELFSPGNILLMDKTGKVLSAQNSLHTKDRTIRGGVEYSPLLKEHDALKITNEELVEVFAKTNKESIVKTLAIDLGFGGDYSEEICTIAKLDKNMKHPSVEEIKKVHKTILKLKEKEIKPVSCENEVFPFALNSIDKKQEEVNGNFSREIGNLLIEKFASKKEEEQKSVQNKEVKKIENIIKKQVEKLELLEKEIVDNQKKGELIYEHYAELQELLKAITDAKKNHSYKEIKKRLIEKELISELNQKEQSITITY